MARTIAGGLVTVLASLRVSDLRWSWLCLPFVVCAAALSSICLVAVLIRGDRVMRLGVIGSAMTALPWAICSSLAACTDDPAVATRLLRLGSAPVAMIGPNLLLVLLGISGQLERHRWVARAAGVIGGGLTAICMATDWTVPGVRRLSSGVFYPTAGPITDVHISQLGMWLVIGLVIARRSMMTAERRRMMRVLIVAFALAAVGSTDMLLIHRVVSGYPVAWLPTTIACGIALYLELATDLLRPRGFDLSALFELGGFIAAAGLIGGLAFALEGSSPVAIAVIASAAWVCAIAAMWALGRRRQPPRVFASRALEQFAAGLSDIDDDTPVALGLTALWQEAAIAVRAIWRSAPAGLIEITSGALWQLDREVISWLASYAEPLAAADLATMRLGSIRPKLEAMIAARGATLVVPLLDRGTLVGVVEADHVTALREAERGLVAESALAAARALTYVKLARLAAREGATAREVEVAEAMRLQAAASQDEALGPWLVAAEYRSAARTTGAAWSAHVMTDGRLAILVTEGQAHGVVSALATAAVTGAFAAATGARIAPGLDELLQTLRASAEGVLRGGEPIAAFVAILAADTRSIAWGCAGHPGAHVVALGAADRTPVALGGGGGALLGDAFGVAMRGETALEPGAALVIASSGVRRGETGAWYSVLRGDAASGAKLAARLVEAAVREGQARDDLLAVVIRPRPGDRAVEP
jgi:hypothetical protein